MRVDIFCNTSIEAIEKESIRLSNAEVLKKPALIWSAGVKTAGYIKNLSFEKTTQGRINVDVFLRCNESCFAVGDAASFLWKGQALRMSVQFALSQGQIAAENIVRIIEKKALKKYCPFDFGYIIPMANNRSCGIILGVYLKGFIPTFLHYSMCVFRSFGLKNKIRMIKELGRIDAAN